MSCISSNVDALFVSRMLFKLKKTYISWDIVIVFGMRNLGSLLMASTLMMALAEATLELKSRWVEFEVQIIIICVTTAKLLENFADII